MTYKYIPIIDYMKAFAILLVTTNHFFSYPDKDFPLFSYVIQMGMPVFMLLIGFNTAMSNDRHHRTTLKDFYAPKEMWRHFAAILPAYTLMFFTEAILTRAFEDGLSLGQWSWSYLTGGLGKASFGGYFIPIYTQYLLVAPLIHMAIRKKPRLALLAALAVNVFYEYLVGAIGIPRSANRLLFVRYLFIATSGQYLYYNRKKISLPLLLAGMAASLVYITLNDYFDLHWFMSMYWKNTSVYASFYYIGLVALALRYFEDARLPEPWHTLGKNLGRATFYIYLTQMLYFRLDLELTMLPLWPRVLIGICLCAAVGTAWYHLDKKIRKKCQTKTT